MTFIDDIGRPLIDLFNFELKFYKSYTVMGVLHRVDFNFDWVRFWAECWRDSRESNRLPFLITKRNQGKPIVWVDGRTYHEMVHLGLSAGDLMHFVIDARDVDVKKRKKKHDIVQLPTHTVSGFLLEQFFMMEPTDVLKIGDPDVRR
jgi:hypothetical protein